LINRFGVLDGSNKPAKKFLMIGGAGGMSSMKE